MRPIFAALLCALVLSGCTDADWNSLTDFDKPAPETVAAETPAPIPAAAPDNTAFCQAVAHQDATGNGFDPVTQQRVAQQSYAQCVTIYGNH